MNKTGVYLLSWVKKLWRQQTLIILAIITLLFAIFVVLSNLPESASVQEQTFARSSNSAKEIIDNPVNAPYKIASLALTSYSPSIKLIRAVSFMYYIGAAFGMFYALRYWHTMQTALITSVAFATNSIVLSSARLGSPIITVMSFFIFTCLLLFQLHSRSNKFVPALVLISLACLLYTPGAAWFLLILSIVYWNRFKNLFKNVKKQAIVIGASLSLIIILPLLISFFKNDLSLNEWLLLPSSLDWSNVPRSILRVPSAFIYRMPEAPLINVARLPIFDLSAGVLFLIGLNAYRKKLKLDRTRVMLASALVSVIVGACGELLLAVIFLLPFAYCIVAAGIEYLLDEWYSVFPKNPLARSFGLIMITSVVLFSVYYQTTRFFVVWPQTPETRSIYNQTRIIYDSSSTDTIEVEKGE